MREGGRVQQHAGHREHLRICRLLPRGGDHRRRHGTSCDVDFFALGSFPANSRVFAIADSVQANSTDPDMRVTDATNSIEYDDDANSTPWGSPGPQYCGSAADRRGVVHRGDATSRWERPEPYRLYAVVQPPGGRRGNSSATAEVGDATNSSLAGANAAGNMFFSGTVSSSTDLDLYRFCAAAGDVITLGIDGDPLRNLTPVQPRRLPDRQRRDVSSSASPTRSDVVEHRGRRDCSRRLQRLPAESATWRRATPALTTPASTTTRARRWAITSTRSASTARPAPSQSRRSQRDQVRFPRSRDGRRPGDLHGHGGERRAETSPSTRTCSIRCPRGRPSRSITGVGSGGNWSCTVPVVGTNGTISCTNSCFSAADRSRSRSRSRVEPVQWKPGPQQHRDGVHPDRSMSTARTTRRPRRPRSVDPGTCSDDNACTGERPLRRHDLASATRRRPATTTTRARRTRATRRPDSARTRPPIFCTASDRMPALVGTCDPETGVCSNPALPMARLVTTTTSARHPIPARTRPASERTPSSATTCNQCTDDACNPAHRCFASSQRTNGLLR